MTPTFRKVALAAAVLGLAVSVVVASCGGDGDDEATPTTATTEAQATTTTSTTDTATTTTTTTQAPAPKTIRITVVGGRPQGGIQRPSVDRDDKVVLVVRSDVVDEIHLHGYDLSAEAGPGKTARIAFTASVPGRFEVELENRGVQIADLEVRP
jgi:hypothetical protein